MCINLKEKSQHLSETAVNLAKKYKERAEKLTAPVEQTEEVAAPEKLQQPVTKLAKDLAKDWKEQVGTDNQHGYVLMQIA